ncbi:Ceramide synthase 6 [Cyanidiococcus yangmingshanensis]|uniref:Ceramide synthase 6 n=1 Tax=Cyanidiococcus yangmingshanensis TaxID=2690220 RepID=A0A7J7IJ37_9RHOD|nr:Ceramide synthase 6 [Cyanidiococcus yangmingshanensis]
MVAPKLLNGSRRAFFRRADLLLYRLRYERAKLLDEIPWQPYNPDFQLRRDALLVALLLPCALVGRYVVESLILKPLFVTFTDRGKKSARMASKMAENCFYALFYVCSLLSGWLVYRSENWRVSFFHGSCISAFWELYPRVSSRFRLFYLSELCYYISSAIFLVTHDTKRKDFRQMIVHHVATISLILLSYIWGWMRLGLIILMLHDAADILLYTAKVVHYLGLWPWNMILFACFAVVFYVTRLFLFPRVILSVSTEPWIEVTREPLANRIWVAYWGFYIVQLLGFAFFLNTLLYLHCFWFTLILKMLKRELLHPRSAKYSKGDIRSDDEDE